MKKMWLSLVVAVLLVPTLQPVLASETLIEESLLAEGTQIDIMGILNRLITIPGVSQIINLLMRSFMRAKPLLMPILPSILSMYGRTVTPLVALLIDVCSRVPVIGPFIVPIASILLSLPELLSFMFGIA